MEARQVAALVEQADRSCRAHDWNGAIELLRRALAIDPEHAGAHGSLALALLGARRLHGAVIEADLALGFDANSAFSHYVAAAVRRAERKLTDAWRHCLVALEVEDDPDARVLGANIKALQGKREEAYVLLNEALAIDGEHVDALTALSDLQLHDGRIDEAHANIERALKIDPSDVDAHIVAGNVALFRNALDEAEQHARFALSQDAASRGAMQLWTAVKSKRSLVLGLWWRWMALVGLRSERGQVGILIGSFLVAHLVIIILGALDLVELETIVNRIWLAFCAYTWFAPEIFQWMLKRELANVVLRDDY